MVNPGNVTPGHTLLVLLCEDSMFNRHQRKWQQRLHGSCSVKSKDAAQHMASQPPAFINDTDLLSKIELLAHVSYAQKADFAYKLPQMLAEFFRLCAPNAKVQLVASCSDVKIWFAHWRLNAPADRTECTRDVNEPAQPERAKPNGNFLSLRIQQPP